MSSSVTPPLIFSSEPLTVSISNHNSLIKNNLHICTENQVQEYYRLWACSTAGRITIEKIIKTVAEYGIGGGSHTSQAYPLSLHNTSNPPSIHSMLMSPHKSSSSSNSNGGGGGSGSPLSPRGRSVGGYGSPVSPSSGLKHPSSPVRSLSETSYGFSSSLLSNDDGFGSLSSSSSSSTATAAPDPTSIAAAVAAAGGIGALLGTGTNSSLTNSTLSGSSTTGLSPHLGFHSSNNTTNAALRRTASASPTLSSTTTSSTTTSGSSSTLNQRFDAVNPLSPTNTNGSNGSVTSTTSTTPTSSSSGNTSASSPGIAIRISPGAAVNNNTIRRSLSGSSMDGSSSSYGLSPKKLSIGSPLSGSSSSASLSSFSLDPDGGFIPTVNSFGTENTLPFGLPSNTLSPPSVTSSPSAMVSSVAAMAAASLSLPISPRLMRSTSAPPLTTVFNTNNNVTSPTYSVPFGGTSSVGPASAISSPGSSPSLSAEPSPVPSPRSSSPSFFLNNHGKENNNNSTGAGAQPRNGSGNNSTDSKYDDTESPNLRGIHMPNTSKSLPVGNNNNKQYSPSDSKHDDTPPSTTTITNTNNTSSYNTESKTDSLPLTSSSSTGGKDLSSLLNAVALHQDSKQAEDNVMHRSGSSGMTTVVSSSPPGLATTAAATATLPPGATKIPTFYKKSIGPISLGMKRKTVSKRPESLLTCPMPPVRTSLPVPPAPRGLPLHALENQRLEDQITTILDIFRQANASTNPIPSNPLNHLRSNTNTNGSRSRSNSLTGGNKGSSASNLSKSMPTTTGNKGVTNNRTSIGAGGGTNNGNRRPSTGSTGSAKDTDTEERTAVNNIKVFVNTSNVNVAWDDAHTAVSLDSFATITKQLCGFPSFFAAPLFRRIKAMYGGNENNQGLPIVSSEWITEATNAYTTYQASLPPSTAEDTPVTTPNPTNTGTTSSTTRAASNGRGRASSLTNSNNTSKTAATPTPAPTPTVPAFERTLTYTVNLNTYSNEEVKNRDTTGVVTLPQFLAFWRNELEPYDSVERFYRLIKQRNNKDGIQATDFMPYLEELLEYHPGLAFLEGTPEFQDRYAKTVIARIFFTCDPTARRIIDLRSLRNSNVVQAFHTVDVIEDINMVNEYFSYEHFYVLYCKFWELDTDHDFALSRNDLSRLIHLTPTVLDRVFLRTGRPFLPGQPRNRMGYEDFCIFFLASEDKTNASSLRYWFNICDIDGDGVLTSPDLRYFYPDQAQKMRDHGMEVVKFEDILCQLHDLLKPRIEGRILFCDFIVPDRIALTGVLFNALFDLDKFQRFEGREGQYVKQIENYSKSQWERYAAVEYQRLASEEEENNVVDQGFNNYNMGGWGT